MASVPRDTDESSTFSGLREVFDEDEPLDLEVQGEKQLDGESSQMKKRQWCGFGLAVVVIVAISVIVLCLELVVSTDEHKENSDGIISGQSFKAPNTNKPTDIATQNPSSSTSIPPLNETTTSNVSESSETPETPEQSSWPGAFPSSSNEVTINVFTDENPKEVFLEWSIRDPTQDLWTVVDLTSPTLESGLHSYPKTVQKDKEYRLRIIDAGGDGNVNGWFTLTDSIPKHGHECFSEYGTLLWNQAGTALTDYLEVFLQIDEDGNPLVWAMPPDPTPVPQVNNYDPAVESEEWPGLFPSDENTLAINLFTDEFPQETTWEWSVQSEKGHGEWEVLQSGSPSEAHSLVSHITQPVELQRTYRLQLSDHRRDGTCCDYGVGWFTLTDSTPSQEYLKGKVIWSETGDALKSNITVVIWIDPYGHAHPAEMFK